MKLERKDLIPIAIASCALGIQLAGVIQRELAWLTLLAAFVMLGAFFVTRRPEARMRATAAELAEAKYLRGVADFRTLLNEACLVKERIIVAADDYEFKEAQSAFERWRFMSVVVIREHLGDTEAALYLDLAPRQVYTAASSHARRNAHRWDEKSILIDHLSRFRVRLAALLQWLRNPESRPPLVQVMGPSETPLPIFTAVRET